MAFIVMVGVIDGMGLLTSGRVYIGNSLLEFFC